MRVCVCKRIGADYGRLLILEEWIVVVVVITNGLTMELSFCVERGRIVIKLIVNEKLMIMVSFSVAGFIARISGNIVPTSNFIV